jgi:TonB family protein
MFERLITGGFALVTAAFLSPEMAGAQSTGAPNETNDSLPRLPLAVAPVNYPVESLIANEEGSVVLRATIGTDGQLSDAQVQTSSGYPRLDEASIFLANDARLPTPPIDAAGEPVSVDVYVDLEWNLPLEAAEEFLLIPELAQGVMPPVQEPEARATVHAGDDLAAAIEQGVHDSVALDVLVSEDGEAENIEILYPSGQNILDRAVEDVVESFRWTAGTENGASVATRIPVVIHFVTIPGRMSDQCHPVPLVSDKNTVTIAGVPVPGTRSFGVTITTAPPTSVVNRWIHVNEAGTVDIALLNTKGGWRRMSDYFVEILDGASDIDVHFIDDAAAACWYYRPLFLLTEESAPRRTPLTPPDIPRNPSPLTDPMYQPPYQY